MRFMHLGDLHLGKRVNAFSMVEDQRHILRELTDIALEKKVDAVLVAGDVYDRPTPSVQAVELADEFITSLVEAGIKVLVIGGNHDSTARLAFASRITREKGLHIAKPYAGKLEWVDLEDGDGGAVRVHLLPFISPFEVRRHFEDREVVTYDDAVAAAVAGAEMGPGHNVLVAHQLVLGTGEVTRSDSEQVSIGGIDEVPASHLGAFDYVALGHLHAPQWVSRGGDGSPAGAIRYCGSPLKYSFSEVNQRKSVTIVELSADGAPQIEELELHPLHGMRELRGTIGELRSEAENDPSLENCYIRAILTEPTVNAKAKLTDLFPLVMRVEFDHGSPGQGAIAQQAIGNPEQADPLDVFASLFESVNGRSLNDDEEAILHDLIGRIASTPTPSGEEGGAA